ncbi:DUF5107 domain-containing protein, partial [Streptomyces sp. SID6041]|nr:DUF5107 domain-containing protein [Streptomyces sp. SID6041]
EFSWLEAYGPLAADPAAALGEDWAAARADVERSLSAALPRGTVDAAYTAWRETAADREPEEDLATGSGWGALEVLRGGYALPGTPFPESTLGPEQEPWRELLRTGVLPPPAKAPARGAAPGAPLIAPVVATAWRDMLETAPANPATEYQLGIAQWHAGDRAQAVRSWERGLKEATVRWPLLYCLAVADREEGHPERAAEHFAEAYADHAASDDDAGALAGEGGAEALRGEAGPEDAAPVRTGAGAVATALGRETLDALLAVDRPDRARALWDRLPAAARWQGAFRLLEIRLLLAEGRRDEARAVYDTGFEVADLREGAETLGELWARVTDEPLPDAYEFRMRPS